MPLSSVQKGAIGQFSVLAIALATGNGQLEVYVPAADNEGRDAEIRRHLRRLGSIGIQIKVTFFKTVEGGSKKSYMTIRFSLPKKKMQNDPRLWYVLAHFNLHKPGLSDPVFVMRADVFHKMARRGTKDGQVWFAMTANLASGTHDRWSPYRVALADLGKRLLEIVDEAGLTASSAQPEMPVGAVWLGRAASGGVKSLRAARKGHKYDLIRQAVLQGNSLSAWYQGHLRLFSPFLLGTEAGDPHVLGYQFDGTSEKPLAPDGSPENWRCLRVAELTKVKVLPGVWHAARKGQGYQHCIDLIDVSAYRPLPGKRPLRRAA